MHPRWPGAGTKTRIATMHSGIDKKAKSDFLFPVNLIKGNDMAAANGAEQTFDRVKAQLKARLGSEVYSSWFGRIKLAEASKGLVRISVPTAFLRSWINSHYLDLISELWKQEDAEILKVEIVVRTATRLAPVVEEVEKVQRSKTTRQTHTALSTGTAPSVGVERVAPAAQSPASSDQRQNVLGSPLDARYTFESFVDGPSNRVAFAAARAVAESAQSAVRFNPLFIH